MKKLFVLFALMVIAFTSYAQVYKMYKTRNYHNQLRLNTMTGEIQQIQDDGQSWEICSAREILGDKEGRFRLYETQNMWTFIMLDTYTGKNWQVQFSVKGEDYMFAAPINIFSLAYPEKSSNWTNRFQMFATDNMLCSAIVWSLQLSGTRIPAKTFCMLFLFRNKPECPIPP